eukprot:scaffold281863_cov17-Prasinocladus_malaysianus.AAC.1
MRGLAAPACTKGPLACTFIRFVVFKIYAHEYQYQYSYEYSTSHQRLLTYFIVLGFCWYKTRDNPSRNCMLASPNPVTRHRTIRGSAVRPSSTNMVSSVEVAMPCKHNDKFDA